MGICYRWMQEETTDRRSRSHPPRCTTTRNDRRIVLMAVMNHAATSRTIAQQIQSVTPHLMSARTIRHCL
ncbi:transposable element Tc1 transposase [Trichonephila clavipes]|nr:transposable element Tc1 transposase [Trichonephila clavipes]